MWPGPFIQTFVPPSQGGRRLKMVDDDNDNDDNDNDDGRRSMGIL